jgi:formamidopyrimidine-DNA glycosylase
MVTCPKVTRSSRGRTTPRRARGKELVKLELRRDPRGRRGPEPGTTITAVDAEGKHLLMHFSDGHVLHTHMQMTGAWHMYAPGNDGDGPVTPRA